MRLIHLLCLLTSMGLALAKDTPQLARASLETNAVQDLILYTQRYTNISQLVPGEHDGNVAKLSSFILQNTHYLRHPMNDEMARRFLKRYLEMLDPQHFHFLKSDIRDFEKYNWTLDDLTARQGNTSPAFEIFARYLKRLEERVEVVAQLLQANEFDFTKEERYTPNRKDLDYPADINEAKELWIRHLKFEYLQEKLSKQKLLEIQKTLSNRYKRVLRTLGEFDTDDVLQLYLSALAQAFDPHSDYMGRDQLETFAISMKLSLFGIGALLRDDDGYCKIVELIAGGPAARSKKLKPNDRIIAVSQAGKEPVDVIGMKLNKVVEMIRGPKGSEVTLTIIPADATDSSERRQLTLIREEVKLEDQEAKSKIIDMPNANGKTNRIGVIDLPSFYATFDLGSNKGKSEPKSTTADVARLIKKLEAEKVEGIVLDLRRNGGGSLEECIKLTGLFIKEGPVVQVRDANDEVSVESDTDGEVLYTGPLVVLTSRFSASASEILAAAIQDYDRGLVVGDSSTHGKGTVQTIFELNRFRRQAFPTNYNPGAMKVTIRKFYRANGSSTQLRGVIPDLVLPSVNNYLETGEGSQDFALPFDTITSARFSRMDMVHSHVEELKRRSQARQDADRDFAYVREDIERYKQMLADKSVSLNEEQRVKEKKEIEERAKARKAEREKRGLPKETFYEIPLKLVDVAGLPAPGPATNSPPETAKSSAEPKAQDDPDSDEADAEEKGAATDVTLEETKRILLDLISLSSVPPKPSTETVRN